MAYYLVRLYSGSGGLPVEEFLKIGAPKLAPQLKEAGGLQRYVAGVTDDGRLVSASVYDSRGHAERGLQVAAKVVADMPEAKGYRLHQSFGGEIIREDQGAAHGERSTHGLGRITSTSMTAEHVADTLLQNRPDTLTKFAGRVRTLVIQLDDGRVFTVGAFNSQNARDQWITDTRTQMGSNEAVRKVFAGGVEEIKTTVLFHQS